MHERDEVELRRAFNSLRLDEPPSRVHAGDIIFNGRRARRHARLQRLAVGAALGLAVLPVSVAALGLADDAVTGSGVEALLAQQPAPASTSGRFPETGSNSEQPRMSKADVASVPQQVPGHPLPDAGRDHRPALRPPARVYFAFPAKEDLDGRRTKDINDRSFPDMYKRDEIIYVSCQQMGGAAYGSQIWDLTREGVWVPDAFVRTGTDSWAPGVPRCAN